MVVDDADVDHYTWNAISGPETAGVAFSVTVQACDALNDLITVYNGTASLSGVGQNGVLTVNPASVTFASGVWTGYVTITTGDPNAKLQINNGAGATGTSNAFVVQPNSVDLQGPWNTFGNGPSHTGYFAGTLTSNPLYALQWSDPVGSNQVAVDGGRVYTTSSAGVTALNEYNGATLWSDTYASPWSINPATYDNGQVYVQTITGNEVGDLWSLNAATGATTWSSPYSCQWYDFYAPTIANGAIYVDAGEYDGLYGFNESNGASLFTASTAQYDEWTPGYYNGKVYTWVAGLFSENNATTGATDWSLSLGWNWYGYSMNTVPAIANNTALVVGDTGLFAVNLTTQAVSWSIADTGFSGSPAVAGNIVYAIHGTQVNAYNVTTGALVGTFNAGQTLIGQPIVTSDGLIAASSSTTFLFSLANRQVLNTIPAGGLLTLADNTLFIAGSTNLSAYTLYSYPPLSESLPANATEGVGAVNGSVSIPAALTTPLTVSLASSDNTRATVPATVTIAVGQTSAVVPITITNTGLLDAPEAVTISASAPDYVAAVGTIQIHSGLTATLSVSLPASAAENGGTLTGTVTASAAPTQNVTVSLSSSGTTHLTVPATVILPAGQASVNFTATLLDDHVIESSPMPVTVAATMDNWTPGSFTINVLDADATLALALPASGWEGQTLSGTVQIGGTLTTPLLVSLASNMTSQLSVPATVTIPAGSLSAAFTATLIDNGQRTGPQNVQITATAGGLSSATANVIVDDADVDHYTFSGLPAAAPAGTAFTVTVRAYDVLNNLITVSNATVPLSATGQGGGSLTVSPATVTFASGVWTGSVSVGTADPAASLKLSNGQGATGTSSAINVYAPLQVASTSPPAGGLLTIGGTMTLTVDFNQPITPSSVTTSSLALSGISGATVSAVSVLSGNATVQFTLSGITSDGTLTASIAAGAVLDQYGYAGAAFSGSYIVQIGTAAFPVPLAAVNPLGSLVYQGSRTSAIGLAGSSENFTIALDPGQTLTAFVAPAGTLEPTVTVTAPGGAVLATATASALGQQALVQTVPIGSEGTYTVTVGGAAGTGSYTLQLELNAAVESGLHGGPLNNTFATAKSLTAALTALGTADQRAAVLGTTAASGYYSMTVGAGQSLTAGLASLATDNATLNLYNGADPGGRGQQQCLQSQPGHQQLRCSGGGHLLSPGQRQRRSLQSRRHARRRLRHASERNLGYRPKPEWRQRRRGLCQFLRRRWHRDADGHRLRMVGRHGCAYLHQRELPCRHQ